MDEVPINTVVAGLAFVGGTALGVIARHMHFCTLGAIADAFLTDNHKRLRGWMLAMATAIFFTQAFHIFGLIDVYGSIYLVPSFGWLGAIVGGICFGFGMALVGTCGYGTLVRLGGGDLRSLVDFLVLGFFAYLTLRGLSGLGRVLFIEPTNVEISDLGNQGMVDAIALLLGANAATIRPLVVGLVVLGLAMSCFKDHDFRKSKTDVLGGLFIGLIVAAGWLVTGVIGADDFEPTRLET